MGGFVSEDFSNLKNSMDKEGEKPEAERAFPEAAGMLGASLNSQPFLHGLSGNCIFPWIPVAVFPGKREHDPSRGSRQIQLIPKAFSCWENPIWAFFGSTG